MKILAAKILKTHGIHGSLKIEVYLDQWESYKKKIVDENDNPIPLESSLFDKKKNQHLIKIPGVNNIEDGFKYIGKQLYIQEEDLMDLKENNFYYYQLINLPVIDEDNNTIGIVDNIINNGGGDILIINLNINKLVYLPFDIYTFPQVYKDKIIISNTQLNHIFQ